MRLLQRVTVGVVAIGLVLTSAACGGDDDAAPPTSSAPSTSEPSTSEPATTVEPSTTVPTTSSPTTTAPPPTTPAPTTAPTTTQPPATTEPAEPVDVKVYFLRGERLVIEHRDVAGPAVLRGSLEALFAGPTAEEEAAGLTSAVPDGTELRSVDLDDGLATVDLTAAYESGGGSLSMMARLAQLVFTSTQFPNVDRVEIWLDGVPVEALGGEGLLVDEPQTRAMMNREITGAVIIDTPEPGATVSSPIRVTGEADVFEAQFPIEIWRDGEQIGGLAPVTGGGMGTWGDFDVTIPIDAAPGPIQIVAYDAGGCGDGPECPEPIRTVIDVELT